MSSMMQRLIVNPVDEVRPTTVMDAPVQLINPDGTPFIGSSPKKAAYVEDKFLTMKALRQALIDAGLMEDNPQAGTGENE